MMKMSWGLCQGNGRVSPGIWNISCEGQGLSLSEELTLEMRGKSAERQSALLGAIHSANGNTLLVRCCLHHTERL